MAQFYTLDEAAGRLSLSASEFRRRLKEEWKDIRPFRDGATLRFRATDIDELARSLGEMSDPSLQLPALSELPQPSGVSSVASPPPPSSGPRPEMKLDDEPTKESMPLLDPPPSSRRIAKPMTLGKPSDSDIRVETPAEDDSALSFSQDELTVDLSGPGSAIAKLGPLTSITGPASRARMSGPPSVKIPAPGPGKTNPKEESSEFDLSFEADSDSFELQLGSDSAEFNLQPQPPLPLATDVPPRGVQSGINLGKPADSGLSLERGGSLSDPPKSGMMSKAGARTGMSGGAGGEFELTLDGPMSSGGSSAAAAGAESEFELTLDDDFAANSGSDGSPKTGVLDADDAQGDIFETDFDLPSLESADDSGSDLVAVDDIDSVSELALDTSDVVADDESASQVMLVDDIVDDDVVAVDDVDEVVEVDELEESPSASGAMRRVRDDESEDEEQLAYPSGGVVAAPQPWGPLPAAVLFLSLPLVFLGGLMSFELLRGMWGYHQPSKPGNMLVRGVADALGMKVNND